MYSAKIQKINGDTMILTGDEPAYQVISIQGLNPPSAQINVTPLYNVDGARFNSAKLQTRNIVLTIRINGEVEKNRLRLYQYFRTKEWCVFYYRNDSVDVSIQGYVESVECNIFSRSELAQISILCPYPYFQALAQEIADSDGITSVFVFPFTINLGEPVVISSIDPDSEGYMDVFNSSETDTGFTMEVEFRSNAGSFSATNVTSGEELNLTYDFEDGDSVIINTVKGQKSITLQRGAERTNIFTSLQPGSVFPQLMAGLNRFDFKVDGVQDDQAVFVVIKYNNLYRGV